MTDQKDNTAVLSPELISQLRAIRAQLMEQYHAHQSGVVLPPEHPVSKLRQMISADSASATLPPEQSLALRSQISYITQVIEPGTKEMWPDFSDAEKAYMADKKQRDANHIAMAALGPFAGPAILYDQAGAPPETVGNLLELGFNMTAVFGLGRHGAQHSRSGEVMLPEPAKAARALFESVSPQSSTSVKRPSFLAEATNQPIQRIVPDITKLSVDGDAVNMGHYSAGRPVSYIKDFTGPVVTARKIIDAALSSGREVEPILNWLNNPQIEKLGLAVDQYGGGRGQLLADLRDISKTGEAGIDGYLYQYRHSPEGRSEAYKDALAFEKRLVMDIAGANGELDPSNLRLVVAKLNSGQYMTARDYAALEQIRDLAHQDFVENKVETYRSMNKFMNLTGEVLQKGIDAVRQDAEVLSPYAIKKSDGHDRDPNPPLDSEPEL